MVNINVTVNRG